jgi:tripartite-type tricarboxylate transporter receptor subunit TctC
VKKALGDAEVRATLARNGIDVVADSTPEAFASLMKDDLQNRVRVAKDANIKTDQ